MPYLSGQLYYSELIFIDSRGTPPSMVGRSVVTDTFVPPYVVSCA